MKRYGITSKAKILEVPKPKLREIAKNQKLAVELWKSGTHEARILAYMIVHPADFVDDTMNSGGFRRYTTGIYAISVL